MFVIVVVSLLFKKRESSASQKKVDFWKSNDLASLIS